jgi:predicted metal-dependent phosphoesterase TrpH
VREIVDLHMHTTCSDGLTSPVEIVSRVKKARLKAFAIADHDTLEGFRVAAGQ